MKIAVIDLPGSNSSTEVSEILSRLNQQVEILQYRADSLKGIDAVIVPGGASFGDYLRPGALAKGTPVMGAIKAFAAAGGPVLGIGNGFQVLCEMGILPGALLQNPDMKFCNRDILVKVESNKSPFTKKIPIGTILKLPMGCYYGSYWTDRRTINDIEEAAHVALRYCDQFGETDYLSPFLGSLNGVAGVVSRHENVLGIMPRPERASDDLFGNTDGLAFFRSLVS